MIQVYKSLLAITCLTAIEVGLWMIHPSLTFIVGGLFAGFLTYGLHTIEKEKKANGK